MSDLAAVVVGTNLRINEQYGSGFKIEMVERVTPTSIYTANHRVRKIDGRLIGESTFSGYPLYARVATSADERLYRVRQVNTKLRTLVITDKQLELAEQLIIAVKDGNAR